MKRNQKIILKNSLKMKNLKIIKLEEKLGKTVPQGMLTDTEIRMRAVIVKSRKRLFKYL